MLQQFKDKNELVEYLGKPEGRVNRIRKLLKVIRPVLLIAVVISFMITACTPETAPVTEPGFVTASVPEIPFPTETPGPAPMPTDTQVTTASPVEAFQIQERIIDASRPDLNVGITMSVPWMVGSERSGQFNTIAEQYADEELIGTIKFLTEPIPEPGGGMSINYAITSSNQWTPGETPYLIRQSSPPLTYETASIQAGHDLITVLFENSGYFGGAHPGSSHNTINFDLATGEKLELHDLFLPGVDYLAYISNYSINELLKRKDVLFEDFQENAGPNEQNYRVWAITRYGILIIFEEYQVAPYASGPQFVMIPYDYLKPIIDPNGPIGAFAY